MIDGDDLRHSSLLTAGPDPSLLAADQLLDQLQASCWMERVGTNNKLIVAAQWADTHPADSIDPHQLDMPGGNRPIHPGGDGTPEIARFCVAVFATTIGKTPGTGELIIADALDLRHRMPRLWLRLHRYEIDGHDCQTITRRIRHLTLEQAIEVDACIADLVGRLSWGRLMNQLEATIIRVDAVNIKRLAEQEAGRVGAWLGQSNDHGVKTLYIRAQSPAVIRLYAQADRIAAILTRRGHTGSKDQRLADAFDVLSNPLQAVRLIAEDTEPTLFDDDPDDDSLLPKPTDSNNGSSDDRDAQTAEGPAGRADRAGHDTGEASTRNEDHPDSDDHSRQGDQSGHGDQSRHGDQNDHDDDELPPDPAADHDRRCCCGSGRFPRVDQDRRLAEQAIAAIGQIDPTKFRPDATLYVHIARETLHTGLGVTRVEEIGPVISSLVADWLSDCNVTVKPVIDLAADLTPVDAYEVPRAMRERMFLKQPGSIFPYSGATGRHLDLDHNVPFVPGLPGQTREDQLGPADRFGHNVITHAGWRRRQPEPGTYLFRAPHGRVFLVNSTGSHDLGSGTLADLIWHATTPTAAK